MDRRRRLDSAHLYLVCDATALRALDGALRGGVDVVQLRDKAASDAELLAVAQAFRTACHAHDALFVLNDRPDLVEAAGADGVHVGQGDAPVARARDAVGPDRLVGLSIDAASQLAAVEDADYLGVGPVVTTPTKPEGRAVGTSLVAAVASASRVPVFAIGGIDLALAGELALAGLDRVAVVRAIVDAEDPEAAARALRAALEVRVGTA